MTTVELLDQNYFYPPTSRNLTLAHMQLNARHSSQDLGGILVVEEALAESSRLHDVENPHVPNPYLDILARSMGLRHALIEQRQFELTR